MKNIIQKLNNLYNRSQDNPSKTIDRDLYKLLCSREMLQLSYENIKSNPGNMTPSMTPETLDGISNEELDKIVSRLQDESFQFRTSKRTKIPKASGGERPLTIAPPRDKLVQEAMRLILNSIYEPLFHEVSHGFRPNKGCHSALKHINQKFQHTTWMIEGDIEKCFDQINHHKLMEVIENKIEDRKFTKLIWKSLRAGYFESRTYKHNIIGTFQGSIISPILANIYLHKLDTEVEIIGKNYNRGNCSKVNPSYNQLRYKERVMRMQGEIEKANEIAKNKLRTRYSLFEDDNYKKIAYVRYADDWLVGVKGSKEDAKKICDQIGNTLGSLNLTLSKTKTKITNINKKKALFLGTFISRGKHTTFSRMKSNSSIKRNSRRLRFEAPLDRISKKLRESEFLKYNKSYPKFIWMSMTHRQIINRYNAVLRGLLNYYKFAHNYGTLASRVEYWLRGSCAKLLAAKYSLGTQNKVFEKFGKSMKCPESTIEFKKPSYKITLKFLTKLNPNGVIQGIYSYKSLSTLDNRKCSVCDSEHRVEMHHIRALKDLKGKSIVDTMMIKAKRKQIPLCRECHMKKHRGEI